MAINFVVETGSASSTSTSYATIAQYKQWLLDSGMSASTLTDDQIKAQLNVATSFIDNTYQFKGSCVIATQALSFPRYECYGVNNVAIGYADVPKQVIQATCYLAYQNWLQPLNTIQENVSSESYGPVSKSYSGGYKSTTYTYVQGLLKHIIQRGSTLVRVN